MLSGSDLRNICCSSFGCDYDGCVATVYRSGVRMHDVGSIVKECTGRATISLNGIGEFTASMVDDDAACEIMCQGSNGPVLWGRFPSARRITDTWQSCEIGGRTLITRYERVPILAAAITIADPTDPARGKAYLGLKGEGVLMYPLFYWPILIPLFWRRRLPACIYDPRVVIGMERPSPADDELVRLAAIVCLCLLATDRAHLLHPAP